MPAFAAAPCMLDTASAGKRRSHNIESGTCAQARVCCWTSARDGQAKSVRSTWSITRPKGTRARGGGKRGGGKYPR
eukprot:scaffold90697_cov31-Tisochrysis_lutea.AAC.3